MAILNRILNVIIVILAILALVIGFKLFERRKELRDNRNELAKSIAKVVKELDTKSPVTLGNEITATDEDNGGGGTLGWRAYHNDPNKLKTLLTKFEDQATTVRSQRDKLGDEIVAMAKIFEDEDVDAAKLNDPEKYAEICKRVKDSMQAYYNRDKYLTEKLIEARKKFGEFDKTVADTRDVQVYQEAFTYVNKQIDFLLARKKRLEDVLENVVQKLEGEKRFKLDPKSIREVAEADVQTLYEGIGQIMDTVAEVELLRKQVEELTKELKAARQEIDETKETLMAANTTIDDQKRKIGTLKQQLDDCMSGGGTDGVKTKKSFDGNVLRVNYDYNYVILDIGAESKLIEGIVMTVARGREYICKAKVTKVYKKYAVAEVLPGLKAGKVVPGDRIFYLAR